MTKSCRFLSPKRDAQAFSTSARYPTATGRFKFVAGFTLVELMIALTLALVISGALVGVLMTNRASYQTDEGLSRLQENGRMAIELLTREIRGAGYMGCLRNALVYNNLNPGATWANFGIPIQAFEANGTGPNILLTPNAPTVVTANGWTPALDTNMVTLRYPPGGTLGAVAGTDVLVIRKMGAASFPLAPPYPPPNPANANLSVDASADGLLAQGQIAIVSDCKIASIFQVSGNPSSPAGGKITIAHATAGNPGNACATWGNDAGCAPGKQSYGSNARLYVGEVSVYFIGLDDANRDANNNAIPTLYRGTVATTGCPGGGGGANSCLRADPLVAGVENMQLLFGVDDNNDRTPDRILTAAQVEAGAVGGLWPLVVTVNVGLLVRSDNLQSQADAEISDQVFLLTGSEWQTGTRIRTSGYNDRRWRRSFNTTVAIRSRGF